MKGNGGNNRCGAAVQLHAVGSIWASLRAGLDLRVGRRNRALPDRQSTILYIQVKPGVYLTHVPHALPNGAATRHGCASGTMPHHDLAYASAAGVRTGPILYRQDESARFTAIGVPARATADWHARRRFSGRRTTRRWDSAASAATRA
jgi:hypothetical protein